jgi:hypothetical protein
MRRFLTFGGLAIACLWIGTLAVAADSYTSYYAEDAAGGQDVAGSSDGKPLLCESCEGNSFLSGSCCDGDCYDCCDSFNDRRRILGMLPSDHCFDSFISPLSNPFFFEDPRSLTEVRGIFIENSLPLAVGNGDFQFYGAQLRGRVSDRVSIIVPRIGFFNANQAGGGTPHGYLSTPIGFKYNFIRDAERQLLVSGGITYFIKGSSDALSNFGDGDFHLFLTGGAQIFDRGHWISGTGFRLPTDTNWGTQMWYWSNQWDYEVVDGIYGLLGINWFHWMRSAGNNFTGDIAGIDLLNLPAGNVAGTNVVTGVIGAKWKPSPHCEVGTGFEIPLTDRTDLLKNRLYADLIFRY